MSSKGYKNKVNGWIYLAIEGSPRARGFAHGYALAAEIKEIFRMLDYRLMNVYGYTRAFLADVISAVYGSRIKENFPEFYHEMVGITKGVNKKGLPVVLADILLWNCYFSIESVMIKLPELVKADPELGLKYGHLFSQGHSTHVAITGIAEHCTAFMAVGSATRDGKIVCGHNTFSDYIDGQWGKVLLDIRPTTGNRIFMQTAPGCIASGTDFYVTSAGLICTETTIGGFNKFALGDPICCRIRQAMQYGSTLDECVAILRHNNGGDYACSWLLGDTRTNTILRLELGLTYTSVVKKTDGYFVGYNSPEDHRIRNLECVPGGHYDIRTHQGARRLRLMQLMDQYVGRIDVQIGKKILADHYDVYLKQENPCSRTCCGHYETDDRAFISGVGLPLPFQPRGTLDGIVCDTTMAEGMGFLARWGSSCGQPFDAPAYVKENAQWAEQEPYLKSRPTQPWTAFSVLTKN